MRVYDKVEYRKYINNLTGEYKTCFEKIEGYIRVCFNGNTESEEKCVYQILGELMSAQGCHKPLSMVIGSNLREYCDKYIKLNQTSKDNASKFLQTLAIYISLTLLLMLVKSINIYASDFANNLIFGVLETVVLIYATLWNVVRSGIAKLAMTKNKWVKNLDIYLNVLFIILIFPLVSLNNNILTLGVKIPLLVFIAIAAVMVALLVYTIKVRKSVKSENEN